MRTPQRPVALPMSSVSARLLPIIALMATAAPAGALPGGPANVLVLGADALGATLDTQAKLQGTGILGQVDVVDGITVTPTLAQLQTYDAVITWSNYNYANSTALGNVLADYVDAGGGVVIATFTNCESSPSRMLLGRWNTGGYSVITPAAGITTGQVTLGVVAMPAHPVMAGVTSLDGGTSSFRPLTMSLLPGSHLIVSWSDGTILAAEHATHANIVDVGIFPPSRDWYNDDWVPSTDGAKLMANALQYASGGGAGTTFCAGDGTGTACPCGNSGVVDNGCASSVSPTGAHLATSGSAHISSDSLVLQGSDMPNSSALYFQGTTQTNGGLGSVFGDGLRCAGGTIIRLKAVTNVSGASHYPGTSDPSISVRGAVTSPGTRTYQIWYRNAAAYCTPSTFNLTNGIEIDWMS